MIVPTYLAEQVRLAEEPYLAKGIPLMSRAACALAQVIAENLPGETSDPARLLFLVGPGNNGGDALFAAAQLAQEGYAVNALPVAGRMHEPGVVAAKDAGVTFISVADLRRQMQSQGDGSKPVADVIIDGILGTGTSNNPALRGTPREVVKSLLSGMNLRHTKVIAVDVPSGLHPDTGEADAVVLPADVTVTFGGVKQGTMLPVARAIVGTLVLVDIGIRTELERFPSAGSVSVGQVLTSLGS